MFDETALFRITRLIDDRQRSGRTAYFGLFY